MPGTRSAPRGERRLERALSALGRALRPLEAPWMIIGGVAIIARGVRRMTTDIDAVVDGGAASARTVLAALARAAIVPRIPDAERFARANLVLLVRHAPTGVDLDVSLGFTAFEIDALSRRSPARFGTVKAPMATADDLLVFKAVAARPKDLEDAAALLALYPKLDVVRAGEHVAALAALADDPALVRGFAAMIGRARKARRR